MDGITPEADLTTFNKQRQELENPARHSLKKFLFDQSEAFYRPDDEYRRAHRRGIHLVLLEVQAGEPLQRGFVFDLRSAALKNDRFVWISGGQDAVWILREVPSLD